MRFWKETDRARMVRKHLRGRGLTSSRLLAAFAEVPRDIPPRPPMTLSPWLPGGQVPPSLKQQLAAGGRLVIPVGDASEQSLVRVTRVSDQTFQEEQLCKVRFVPLVGEEGWQSTS